MSGKGYPDEFKIGAIKQVVEGRHSVAYVRYSPKAALTIKILRKNSGVKTSKLQR